MNAQRVNVGFDICAERFVNHSMSGDTAATIESIRHDPDVKVPLAFFRSGMSRMQMTLVFDQEFDGRKRRPQQTVDFRNPFGSHGSTILNGFTVTLA